MSRILEPTAAILLGCTALAHANNERRITPDEPLFIEFRVDAGATGTPDTFAVYLGQPEATDPGTGQRSTRLSNQGLGIAFHQTSVFGDVIGPIDMKPGATFASADSPYTVLDPGEIESGGLSAMAMGTESGLIELSITSGVLIVDLDDVRIEWGQGTGPETYTASDVQPEITDMYVGSPCYADFDRNGTLDVFDFLAYQNAFSVSDYRADCDGCGSLDIFDFLCFLTLFNDGCP
ncbi:MAG: GC-type dockerin domain-anchored protein [Phycisphaerales bacterium JB060]